MDIGAILQGTFAGFNIKDVLVGIVSGAVLLKLVDEFAVKLLLKYWPEQAVNQLLNRVQEFDDNYIDPLKKKYPKLGRELELKIAGVLDKAEKIILDQ